MTGPSLPFKTPTSNAIGLFQIGVGAMGTTPSPFNIWTTILSQYANSPRLMGILESAFAAIDQTENLDNLFDLIRNVDTAQGYGLDVWARIVAINRILEIAAGPRYFGFEEGLPDYDPFNTSPFWSGQKLTQNYIVSDSGFRVMILAKAFSNICDGSIAAINRLLVMLFGGSGRCYVVDNQDMTLTFKFEFTLTSLQIAILTQSGVMPRPVGVTATIEQL